MNKNFDRTKFEERIKLVESLIEKIDSHKGVNDNLHGYDHQTLLQLIQLSGYFRIFLKKHSLGEEFTEMDQSKIKDFETDFDNLINSSK